MGNPQYGWFIVEHTAKIDGFGGTPIYGKPHMIRVRCCDFQDSLNHSADFKGNLQKTIINHHCFAVFFQQMF